MAGHAPEVGAKEPAPVGVHVWSTGASDGSCEGSSSEAINTVGSCVGSYERRRRRKEEGISFIITRVDEVRLLHEYLRSPFPGCFRTLWVRAIAPQI